MTTSSNGGRQIDEACGAAGVQPDLHLSGHVRLYEDIPERLAESRFPISLPERAATTICI
jgi:hypothetical protein